jgi:hypothetical protein
MQPCALGQACSSNARLIERTVQAAAAAGCCGSKCTADTTREPACSHVRQAGVPAAAAAAAVLSALQAAAVGLCRQQ